MSNVNFLVLDSLGNYVGKGGKVEFWEFELQLYTDRYLPVTLTKANGTVEIIHCTEKLTQLINKVPSVILNLPYFQVIELGNGEKRISINRVSENELHKSNYEFIIHSLEEYTAILRKEF